MEDRINDFYIGAGLSLCKMKTGCEPHLFQSRENRSPRIAAKNSDSNAFSAQFADYLRYIDPLSARVCPYGHNAVDRVDCKGRNFDGFVQSRIQCYRVNHRNPPRLFVQQNLYIEYHEFFKS